MSASRVAVFFLFAGILAISAVTCQLTREQPDPASLIELRNRETFLREEVVRAEDQGRAEDVRRLREESLAVAEEHRRAVPGITAEDDRALRVEPIPDPRRK
jgi:hypothetical protein